MNARQEAERLIDGYGHAVKAPRVKITSYVAARRIGVEAGSTLDLDPDQEPRIRDGGRWVLTPDGRRERVKMREYEAASPAADGMLQRRDALVRLVAAAIEEADLDDSLDHQWSSSKAKAWHNAHDRLRAAVRAVREEQER